MLKLEDIKYPITFLVKGNNRITYNSANDGKWHGGGKCQLPINDFICCHNNINPENLINRDYYYTMGVWGYSNREIFVKAKPEIKPVIQCTQIENMPVSATIKGVQLDSESWIDITATPKTIEVHDDVVILLLHYGGFKHKTVSGEISIKRGTLVRYEVK
ncbi:TPA: hypothetical protein ACHR5Y_004805 [Escherichia coli]